MFSDIVCTCIFFNSYCFMNLLYAIHNWQMIVDFAGVFFLIKESKCSYVLRFRMSFIGYWKHRSTLCKLCNYFSVQIKVEFIDYLYYKARFKNLFIQGKPAFFPPDLSHCWLQFKMDSPEWATNHTHMGNVKSEWKKHNQWQSICVLSFVYLK